MGISKVSYQNNKTQKRNSPYSCVEELKGCLTGLHFFVHVLKRKCIFCDRIFVSALEIKAINIHLINYFFFSLSPFLSFLFLAISLLFLSPVFKS
jgi:hypothetical protein